MYVCICHAVTDSTIRKAVEDGVTSLQELSFQTGAGTQCGSCVQQARSILDESLHNMGHAASEVRLKVISNR